MLAVMEKKLECFLCISCKKVSHSLTLTLYAGTTVFPFFSYVFEII